MSVMNSPVLKYSDGVLRKNQEMDSNISYQHHHHHQQQQQHCHQQNSGLLRYRSAPSSLLASLVDNKIGGCVSEEALRSEDPQHGYHVPCTSSVTLFPKVIPSNNGWSNSEHVQEYGGKPVTQETGNSALKEPPQQQNGYSYGSQLIYQSQQIQGLPSDSSGGAGANAFDGSFGVVNSINSDHSTQSKMGVRSCSNLTRQKSSPAGLFSSENGLAALREEVGSFRTSDVSNGQPTASSSGLNGTLSFSSRISSCLKRMPQIAENENECLEGTTDQSRNLVSDNGSSKCFVPSFTSEFWGGSAFNSQKAASEDEIMFSTSNALESQDSDFCSQNLGLTHHLSLPSSSSTKMASVEKFLQLQGTVPCKIRAKRGFATHPRSIAERVRRTRISERIKKLEGLFPKSDKQTSTADMLDLAVEHIKELQEQVKILTNIRAKCRCTNNQKQYS